MYLFVEMCHGSSKEFVLLDYNTCPFSISRERSNFSKNFWCLPRGYSDSTRNPLPSSDHNIILFRHITFCMTGILIFRHLILCKYFNLFGALDKTNPVYKYTRLHFILISLCWSWIIPTAYAHDPKIQILSSFTRPHAVSNAYYCTIFLLDR